MRCITIIARFLSFIFSLSFALCLLSWFGYVFASSCREMSFCYLSIVIPRLIFIENNTISLPFQVPFVSFFVVCVFVRSFVLIVVLLLFFLLLLLLHRFFGCCHQIDKDRWAVQTFTIYFIFSRLHAKNNNTKITTVQTIVFVCIAAAAIHFCGCHFLSLFCFFRCRCRCCCSP